MIIIEGYDASGKSTLAERLAREFKLRVLHPGGPTHDEQETIDWLNRCLDRMGERVVQDRVTHISEIVYNILRNPIRAGIAMSRLSDLRNARCFIYCRAPTATILEALKSQHVVKSWDSVDHLLRVQRDAEVHINIYDATARAASYFLPSIAYDRTATNDLRRVIDFVGRFMK